MPHFESIPAIDEIAPEDLLPPTPKRGPKPPVQKEIKSETREVPRMLPKISVKGYKPPAELEQLANNMLKEQVLQGG